MERNTAHISLAVPGADLNLTSEKAPATATDAPMLPLTIMIITATMAGSIAIVTRNPLDLAELREYTSAISAPRTSAATMLIAKPCTVSVHAVNMLANIFVIGFS